MPKIAIVEDHNAIAEMIDGILRPSLNDYLPSLYTGFAEALTNLPTLHPDLVIFDQRLGDGKGTDLTAYLRYRLPKTRWLLFSGYISKSTLTEALEAGVDGIVAKNAPLKVLVSACCAVLAGQTFYCERTSRLLREPSERLGLTVVEQRIVNQVACGMSPKEIAATIGVAYKTVLNDLVVIRRKTGTSSMVQIADYARKHGLTSDFS